MRRTRFWLWVLFAVLTAINLGLTVESFYDQSLLEFLKTLVPDMLAAALWWVLIKHIV
jgi:undecaprenyl pyrophosphate phosphatase UppP